jgi:hypothetical protein
MVKQSKSQRLREKMQTDVKYSKQTTLGGASEKSKAESVKAVMKKIEKCIEIGEISTSAREDELVLKVTFSLVPSRTFFSRVTSDLYFDGEKIDALRLQILQGPLATDEFEFSAVLDLTGITAGKHILRAEMYELWDSGERLSWTSKETAIDYVPTRREERLIRVPIIKSAVGSGSDVVTDRETSIYREIDRQMREEAEGRRERW